MTSEHGSHKHGVCTHMATDDSLQTCGPMQTISVLHNTNAERNLCLLPVLPCERQMRLRDVYSCRCLGKKYSRTCKAALVLHIASRLFRNSMAAA